MKNKFWLVLGLLLSLFVFFLFTGCQTAKKRSAHTSVSDLAHPVVYTTIYPLYDLTKKIGGTKVTVINLTPVGGEPHSFEPSGKLIAALSKSSLFLYHGAGMEPYLGKLLHTLQGTPLLMIETSRGINLISYDKPHDPVHDHTPGHTAHADDQVHNLTFDPHTWLSPNCALQLARNILQALIQTDPERETYFQNNFHAVEKKFLALEREYRDALAHCPKKEIVVTHEAFGYLCREYGLTQISVMGLNTEAEPTPGALKEIIDLIRDKKIKYIFAEALFSPKLTATISGETHAEILVLHPLGSLTTEEIKNGKDYFVVMRENLENLKTALEYTP